MRCWLLEARRGSPRGSFGLVVVPSIPYGASSGSGRGSGLRETGHSADVAVAAAVLVEAPMMDKSQRLKVQTCVRDIDALLKSIGNGR